MGVTLEQGHELGDSYAIRHIKYPEGFFGLCQIMALARQQNANAPATVFLPPLRDIRYNRSTPPE
jgi:hypothetical protein